MESAKAASFPMAAPQVSKPWICFHSDTQTKGLGGVWLDVQGFIIARPTLLKVDGVDGGSDVLYLVFQGVFCVGVSEGQDLVKKDKHLIGGKSDPYVVLKIGESKVSFKVTLCSS